jgi:hypothetical protein|tara:strand:- start:194 stop:394 length:201 start_codon:yes stop_codon:yes gene_type:complete
MESPKVEKRKAECPPAPKKKKRKKKKQSYKQMMRDILKPKDTNKDSTEKLEKVTGGGVPEKLTDRI